MALSTTAPRDLGALATELTGAVRGSTGAHLRERGLSALEYAVLRTLGFSGQVHTTQLSQSVGADLPATSRAVAKLADRGYIRRRRRRDDRRIVMLSLTDQGTDIASSLHTAVDARHGELMADITEQEFAAFASVVHRIADNARKAHAD